jgi:hypothetical protein
MDTDNVLLASSAQTVTAPLGGKGYSRGAKKRIISDARIETKLTAAAASFPVHGLDGRTVSRHGIVASQSVKAVAATFYAVISHPQNMSDGQIEEGK